MNGFQEAFEAATKGHPALLGLDLSKDGDGYYANKAVRFMFELFVLGMMATVERYEKIIDKYQ